MRFTNVIFTINLILISFSIGAQDPYEIDGRVFYIQNSANGKYLSVDKKNNGSNGSNVMVMDKGTEAWKQWKFEYVRTTQLGAAYYIINQQETRGHHKYLEVISHDVGKNGGRIQIWEQHEGKRQRTKENNQLWEVRRSNSETWLICSADAKSKGKYALEIPGSQLDKNEVKVQTWWNSGGVQQREWLLREVK